MKQKGRVLVVTYYIPPKNHIASQRMNGLCEFLSRFGWDIVVLTADHPTEFESPYEVISTDLNKPALSRLISWYKNKIRPPVSKHDDSTTENSSAEPKNSQNSVERVFGPMVRFLRNELVHYPDDKRLWENNAVEVGEEYIVNHEITCIISSSGPFTSHRIASRLNKHHDIPWIADYRDWWSQNPYKNHTNIRELFEKRMEKKTTKPANEIVTVSEPIAKDLSELHKRNVRTITNGHDKSRFPNRDLRDNFTILYPGQFYRKKRNPEMLFSAISHLLDEKIDPNDIQIEFYGYAEPWVNKLADQYSVQKCISIRDFVPQTEILKRERESHCLLSLHWDDSRAEGVYTGKIFEYLGAERPIAAINPPYVVEQLLEETGAGESFSNDVKLADWIHDQYRTFRETGEVNYEVDPTAVKKYSQQTMAKEFENLIVKNSSG